MATITEHVSGTTASDVIGAPNALRNPARRGPVVLATDGTSSRGATVVAARMLADRLDVPLQVVSVLESSDARDVDDPAIAAARRDERETVVRDYVCRFSGGAAPAPVHVCVGNASHEIAAFARDISATAIIVGSAPHRRLNQIVSGERAARVLQSADCPVLSVPPSWTSLPRTVVAAVDFSPASKRAAQAALLLLADGGVLVLTHVLPKRMAPAALASPPTFDPEADARFLLDQLRDDLYSFLPENGKIETMLVTGDPGDALLDTIDRLGAEMIAVGTRGAGLVSRLFLGSVASRVLHGSSGAVLGAPPPSSDDAVSGTT